MPTIWIDDQTKKPPARDQNDHYPTEQALITATLEYLAHNKFRLLKPTYILDAGAGNDGRWGRTAAEVFWCNSFVGVELRDVPKPPGFCSWFNNTDFLQFEHDPLFDLIVSNPPYNKNGQKPPLAERFIHKAWSLLAPVGGMVMLLPLDYQVGIARYQMIFQQIPPCLVMPVVRRVDFEEGSSGGTNNHCIFVWAKDRYGLSVGEPNKWPTVQLYYERDKTK